MARLLSKANLTAHVAATEVGRYAIDGLHLADDGVYSTDGAALLWTPYPSEEVEEHPDGTGPTPTGTLPLAAVQKAVKLWKRSYRPVLERIVVRGDGGELFLVLNDLESSTTVRTRSLEGKFPDAQGTLTQAFDRDRRTVRLGLARLKQLVTALEKTGADDVVLGVSGDGPLTVEAWDGDQEMARGLLMRVTDK